MFLMFLAQPIFLFESRLTRLSTRTLATQTHFQVNQPMSSALQQVRRGGKKLQFNNGTPRGKQKLAYTPLVA